MVASSSNCRAKAGKNARSSWILLITWLTKLHCRCTQPPTSRFSGNWFVCAAGSSSTSVDPSESASSDAATVGDGGVTSCSKLEGAGVPSGVKNCSSVATMPSSDERLKGDGRGQGGIGIGDDEDKDA